MLNRARSGLRCLAIAASHRFTEPASASVRGGYQRSADALATMFADAGVTTVAPQRAATVYIHLMVIGPTGRAMFGVRLSRERRKRHVADAVGTARHYAGDFLRDALGIARRDD